MVKKGGITFLLAVIFAGCLWSFFDGSYHEVLPLEFSDASDPVVEVTINGKGYPLAVDLGSKFFIELDSKVLEDIPKERAGVGHWINAFGNKYTQPKYKLREVFLGKQSFQEVFAIEQSSEEDCLFWKSSEEKKGKVVPCGHIGRRLLKKRNFLIDCDHKRFIVSNSLRRLKKEGYDLSTFHIAPFEMTSKAIYLKIDTDQGWRNYLLDTGSTVTLLKDQLYPSCVEKRDMGLPLVTTERFVLNGKDFGPMNLHLLPFPDEFIDVHGILGMDFINHHPIYLDFHEKLAYIGG
ncbi:MAG: hypothetical protein KDK76_05750 [Chlamydiia bacterium]|nr:hypothetical protein [Chlamydiia bacterium]